MTCSPISCSLCRALLFHVTFLPFVMAAPSLLTSKLDYDNPLDSTAQVLGGTCCCDVTAGPQLWLLAAAKGGINTGQVGGQLVLAIVLLAAISRHLLPLQHAACHGRLALHSSLDVQLLVKVCRTCGAGGCGSGCQEDRSGSSAVHRSKPATGSCSSHPAHPPSSGTWGPQHAPAPAGCALPAGTAQMDGQVRRHLSEGLIQQARWAGQQVEYGTG